MTIDDLLLGTKLACVAITDDEEGTLAKVAKMNPWHTEALAMITGSEEEAHKPLTHILDRHFDLQVDKIINLTGWSGGHPIDTQGCECRVRASPSSRRGSPGGQRGSARLRRAHAACLWLIPDRSPRASSHCAQRRNDCRVVPLHDVGHGLDDKLCRHIVRMGT